MNGTQLQYWLSNDTLGTLAIKNPIGWDTSSLTLSRDKEYFGIFEIFEAPLTFFWDAINYFEQAQAIGLDTEVILIAEISEDYGETFESFYSGVVALETKNETDWPSNYKDQYNIKQNSLLATFKNRLTSAVDLKSVTDLDGYAVAPTTSTTINLPTQIIDRVCQVETFRFDDSSYTDLVFDFTAVNKYGAFDLPNKIIDEIKTKFTLPAGTGPDFPVSLINLTEDGTYDFDIAITIANDPFNPTEGPSTVPGAFGIFLRVAGVDYALVRTDYGVFPVNQYTQYTYTGTVANLVSGQSIFIYGVWGLAGADTFYILAGGIRPGQESHIKITGHTTFGTSGCNIILLKDALDGVIRRICPSSLYSPFFNSDCGKPYALSTGLLIRGFDLVAKPLSVSFQDLFKDGADPILNLGLDTEVVGGLEKIFISEKIDFFDNTGHSILLPFINKVSRTKKLDSVNKSFDIGYSKWEKTGGGTSIDDPQSSHKYNDPLRFIGNSISRLSRFIAASLLWEETRRIRNPGDTWDLDNDIFILKLKTDLTGPDLDGVATNLRNPTTRYNKSLTPARNFLRHLNLFNIGLKQYVGGIFKFISGVGNFTASINISPDGCPGEFAGALAENADIPITNEVLHGVDVIDFTYELTWTDYKTIKANKRKRIGVATDGINYTYWFIDKIDFYLFLGKAKFTLFADS